MKQFAKKSRRLSIVMTGAGTVAEARPEEIPNELRASFGDWLNSVGPTLLPSDLSRNEPRKGYRGPRALTATDILRVNRATIRESTAPRVWPPDVVLTFLAADVIRRYR